MEENVRPVRRRRISQRELRKRRRRALLGRVLVGLLCLLLLTVIVTSGIWLLGRNRDPNISIPTGGWRGYRNADKESVSELALLPLTRMGKLFQESGAFLLYPTGRRVPEASVTVLALGDNLMHSTVVSSGEKADGTYDFTQMYRYIRNEVQSVDLACINQETIFIDNPAEYTNYPIFGGPTAVGEALAKTGFDVVTHATNHCYDKFFTGISDTLRFWRKYPEILPLGIHDSQQDADTIRVADVNGIRIALLNYTYGTNMGSPEEPYMIDFLDQARIKADLKKARKQSDLILVFPHWGTEGSFTPDADQREWAQFFADQGVAAVIGCHPHTLQPMEILKGKKGNETPVFWSMGNFISHMRQPENQLGGMVRFTIRKDRFGCYLTDLQLIPTMTYGTEDFGAWQFYGMRLEDYTEEMADHHWVAGTSVEEMWELYRTIIPEE